jgi:hypothetical protein
MQLLGNQNNIHGQHPLFAMPNRKLSALIGNTTGLSALNRTLQRIAALQRLYEACAPSELIPASRVVGDRGGILLIAADNGAIGAKLRQLAPRLLKNMQKQRAEVTGIHIQVQVFQPAAKPSAPPEKTPLSIDSIDNFENLSRRVKDPGLSAALARFAARQRAKA